LRELERFVEEGRRRIDEVRSGVRNDLESLLEVVNELEAMSCMS